MLAKLRPCSLHSISRDDSTDGLSKIWHPMMSSLMADRHEVFDWHLKNRRLVFLFIVFGAHFDTHDSASLNVVRMVLALVALSASCSYTEVAAGGANASLSA